jgi:hypothetical protein
MQSGRNKSAKFEIRKSAQAYRNAAYGIEWEMSDPTKKHFGNEIAF